MPRPGLGHSFSFSVCLGLNVDVCIWYLMISISIRASPNADPRCLCCSDHSRWNLRFDCSGCSTQHTALDLWRSCWQRCYCLVYQNECWKCISKGQSSREVLGLLGQTSLQQLPDCNQISHVDCMETTTEDRSFLFIEQWLVNRIFTIEHRSATTVQDRWCRMISLYVLHAQIAVS